MRDALVGERGGGRVGGGDKGLHGQNPRRKKKQRRQCVQYFIEKHVAVWKRAVQCDHGRFGKKTENNKMGIFRQEQEKRLGEKKRKAALLRSEREVQRKWRWGFFFGVGGCFFFFGGGGGLGGGGGGFFFGGGGVLGVFFFFFFVGWGGGGFFFFFLEGGVKQGEKRLRWSANTAEYPKGASFFYGKQGGGEREKCTKKERPARAALEKKRGTSGGTPASVPERDHGLKTQEKGRSCSTIVRKKEEAVIK